MSRPSNIPVYRPIDLKLGIKSSLKNVKSTIALFLLIFESEGRPDAVVYSKEVGNTTVVEKSVENNLKTFLNPIYTTYGESDTTFINAVNTNALFNSQIEHLEVALELIYRIGQIFFTDTTKSFSAERTGGKRFAKKLVFSAYVDLFSTYFDSSVSDKYKETLLNWLGLASIPVDPVADSNLCRVLTVISENAIFKMVDGTENLFFNQNEIYKAVISNPGVPIDICGDDEEKGALRIIKKAFGENINPNLSFSVPNVTLNTTIASLSSYQSRVEILHKISSVKIPSVVTGTLNKHTGISPKLKRNKIFFGAPGTGKSYRLNAEIKDIIDNNNQMERVTFYPDYSYSQFIGTYKPVSDTNGGINYKFVPGPFTRVLVKALESGRSLGADAKKYFLVVEEINRAKVAAVFGDTFQLLDRNSQNYSEYTIQASEDLKKYLAEQLGGEPQAYEEIFIPDNMFIWATMNSADQGVFPMDTAFKRRWDFEYIGIDDDEITEVSPGVKVENIKLRFRLDNNDVIRWNVLRRAINAKLSSDTDDIRVHEDKLMGPFFIKCDQYTLDSSDIISTDEENKDFLSVFCEKVLMYLFEDVARTRRDELFEGIRGKCRRYSEVRAAFMKDGLDIFGKDFKAKYYDLEETKYDAKKADEGV
jgi:hypothetical protein